MSQQVRGVIARSKGAPVEIATIIIPDPGPGEVVVAVSTCGVCHTDLTYRDGGINDKYPFLLGHEAAGIVESIGAGVDSVEVGDFVVLNWRAVCGQCRACKRGRPQYCFDTFNATQKMTLEDGTELSPALGIGAFAEKTLVAAGQCVRVDAAARGLSDALAPGTGAVVTADHGMVDVPRHRHVLLTDDTDLVADVRLIGGEPRMLHLYAEPGTSATPVSGARAIRCSIAARASASVAGSE